MTSPPPARPHRPLRLLVAVLLVVASGVGLGAFVTERAATAAVHRGNGWTTNASTGASSVQRGRSVGITVTVSAATARSGRVSLSVIDPSGRRIPLRAWSASFDAGRTRTFSARWAVAPFEPVGRHTVRVAVFNSSGRFVHWNRNAATLSVTGMRPQFAEGFATRGGFYNRFQREVLHGSSGQVIRTWQGDHNHACEAPTTARTVHVGNHAEMFWWCAPAGPSTGHVMTSMYTTGYAQVDFAPRRVFSNLRRVCWDQNQTEMGGRKWTQLVVVPESLYQRNGRKLSYVSPALQNDVAVRGERLTGDAFMLVMLRGSTEVRMGQTGRDVNWSGFTTTDKARRFRTCVTELPNGRVRIALERASSTEVRTLRGSFPDGPVRVIFQDDSYDPPKGTMGNAPNLSTWHWDDITVF